MRAVTLALVLTVLAVLAGGATALAQPPRRHAGSADWVTIVDDDTIVDPFTPPAPRARHDRVPDEIVDPFAPPRRLRLESIVDPWASQPGG